MSLKINSVILLLKSAWRFIYSRTILLSSELLDAKTTKIYFVILKLEKCRYVAKPRACTWVEAKSTIVHRHSWLSPYREVVVKEGFQRCFKSKGFRLKLETRTKTCQFDRVFSLQGINISFFLRNQLYLIRCILSLSILRTTPTATSFKS